VRGSVHLVFLTNDQEWKAIGGGEGGLVRIAIYRQFDLGSRGHC